jgi:hypothetical protein
MLIVTINKKDYNVADRWHDVKLIDFVNYLKNVLPTAPQALKDFQAGNKDALTGLSDADYYASFMPFFCRVVAAFSDIPYSVLMQCNPHSLEGLYKGINAVLTEPKDENVKAFRIQGELYRLPEKFMQGSKVEDFVEAAHLEKAMGKESQWDAIALVACVLLRKDKEPYHDDLLKRDKMFLRSLTMWQAYQISFFLSRLNSIYSAVSQIALTHLAPKLSGLAVQN